MRAERVADCQRDTVRIRHGISIGVAKPIAERVAVGVGKHDIDAEPKRDAFSLGEWLELSDAKRNRDPQRDAVDDCQRVAKPHAECVTEGDTVSDAFHGRDAQPDVNAEWIGGTDAVADAKHDRDTQ